MGVQLSWESTCFASRGSSVRSRSSPPAERQRHMFIRAHSSGGQSARLISVRSVVRVHLSPPIFANLNFFPRSCTYVHVARKKSPNSSKIQKKTRTRRQILVTKFDISLKRQVVRVQSEQHSLFHRQCENAFAKQKIFSAKLKKCTLKTEQSKVISNIFLGYY